MDSDTFLIILFGVGVYFYLQNQQNQIQPPSIGDNSGSALIGVKDEVAKEAAKVGSFFKNDIPNFFTGIGNGISQEAVHDAYKVNDFFNNDVKDFFVNTGNAIGNGVKNDANEVKSFFEKTIPNWFGF